MGLNFIRKYVQILNFILARYCLNRARKLLSVYMKILRPQPCLLEFTLNTLITFKNKFLSNLENF